LYSDQDVITVSASTRDDLRRLGFAGQITVIPEGVETISKLEVAKGIEPDFLFVGRLAPSKRVGDLIRAFAAFFKTINRGDLYLLGDGSSQYVERLRHLVGDCGLSTRVHFLGRLSTLEKHRAMARASALLMASVREGWGLVVTEANALGTPAIGYDVPGLRDSIKHLETGLLVNPSPDALAEAMLLIWLDAELRSRLSNSAAKWSSTFSFENTAAGFRDSLANTLAPARVRARAANSAKSVDDKANGPVAPYDVDSHR
jgi:glycosyltransferase involved in cell wall biosynthesis